MTDKDLITMNNNFKIHVLYNDKLNRTIKLYEMLHIAVPGFYQLRDKELLKDIDAGYVIHHEGVQTPDKYKSSYAPIAKMINMEHQVKPTYPFEAHDATWDNTNALDRGAIRFVSFMIRSYAKTLENSDKESEKMQKLLKELREKIINSDTTPDKKSTMIGSVLKPMLIKNRNIIALKAAYDTDKNISMVWGKAHVSDFIKDFENHGFVKVKEYIPVIND